MSSDAHPEWLTLVLASPSGAGKTTLKNRLLAEFDDLRFSVSHTTRPRRPHEADGREYHFVSREAFEAMVERGEFAEYAEVFGNLYGTGLGELRPRAGGLPREMGGASQGGVVLDLDVQGARQMAARLPGIVTVFILPPSLEELARRLRARADEPEESVQRRLAEARVEIERYSMFDYLIVNDDLEAAYARLKAVVVAERSKRWRQAPRAERLLARPPRKG